ncbi:MAG: lipopolysaccharide biosynthesis protein [Bacteroidales bacterium]|nr:lipopolysaccharide biosynthesis protein [Bacteroidales bacterium]
MSLKLKAVNGVIWNSIETIGNQLIQFLITILLARILLPEDFGVIGLLLIFSELSRVIQESGFTQALIRKNNVSQSEFSSIFFFNILISLALYLLLYFSSPLIAEFYNFPELTSIARVSFLAILINSFGIVQNAIVVKELKFKILAKRTITANFLAGIISVLLAYFGFGVWALVFQIVFASFLRVLLLWIMTNWMPSKILNFKLVKEIYRFSLNLLISGIFDVIVSNIQSLLIGKFYSRADLGFYSQASRMQRIPSATLTSIAKNVSYPILVKVQDSDEQLKKGYKEIIEISFFIVFPIMIFLLTIGENLIIFLLSDKWIESVDYFRILCIVGAIYPLYSINLNIFLVKGNSKMFLKTGIVKRIISLVAIIITVKISILYMIWGHVFATILNTFITMYFSGKLINYGIKEQINDLKKVFICTLITSIILFLFDYYITLSSVFLL